MPYIKDETRPGIRRGIEVAADRCGAQPGNLNYAITTLVHMWIRNHPRGVCYSSLNEAVGVLECAKAEFYRTVVAPYEDKKREENGDIGILGT